MYDDVAEFHQRVLGVTPPYTPTLVSPEFQLERARFMAEEYKEAFDGYSQDDIVKVIDGYLDIIYVALGTLHMMGVPVQDCWNAVQRANMAKQRGVTKRGNKVDAAKPEGWVGPEGAIRDALRARGWVETVIT